MFIKIYIKMNETKNLHLPLLRQGQLNKDITVNDALVLIDSILNASLKTLAPFQAPPIDLEEGDLILVAENAIESFEGKDGCIAFYNNGWRFIKPREGLMLWARESKALAVFNGEEFALQGELKNVKSLSINTQEDKNNRLSVCSQSSLFNAEEEDVRIALNKSSDYATSSFIFQNKWQGIAEFGAIGGNNFMLKVSQDGKAWKEIFEVEASTGKINFKHDVLKNGIKIF